MDIRNQWTSCLPWLAAAALSACGEAAESPPDLGQRDAAESPMDLGPSDAGEGMDAGDTGPEDLGDTREPTLSVWVDLDEGASFTGVACLPQSFGLVAGGGRAPYRWSVSGGSGRFQTGTAEKMQGFIEASGGAPFDERLVVRVEDRFGDFGETSVRVRLEDRPAWVLVHDFPLDSFRVVDLCTGQVGLQRPLGTRSLLQYSETWAIWAEGEVDTPGSTLRLYRMRLDRPRLEPELVGVEDVAYPAFRMVGDDGTVFYSTETAPTRPTLKANLVLPNGRVYELDGKGRELVDVQPVPRASSPVFTVVWYDRPVERFTEVVRASGPTLRKLTEVSGRRHVFDEETLLYDILGEEQTNGGVLEGRALDGETVKWTMPGSIFASSPNGAHYLLLVSWARNEDWPIIFTSLGPDASRVDRTISEGFLPTWSRSSRYGSIAAMGRGGLGWVLEGGEYRFTVITDGELGRPARAMPRGLKGPRNNYQRVALWGVDGQEEQIPVGARILGFLDTSGRLIVTDSALMRVVDRKVLEPQSTTVFVPSSLGSAGWFLAADGEGTTWTYDHGTESFTVNP